MIKYTLLSALCLFLSVLSFTQVVPVSVQTSSLSPDTEYDNVTNRKIYSDSSVTTFVIWVKKNVPLHKHAFHTEQVIVLEGTAAMQVGGSTFSIGQGDIIFIPENTPHQVTVTSATPLKVMSIQAPELNGDDRILIEPIIDH